MQDNILYKENRASFGIFVILFLVSLTMVVYLVIQLIYGPVGSKPSPDWVLALLVLIFILSTINFSHIRILLTDEHIKVYYGLFGTTLKWKDIVSCEPDEKNHFYGWGIRFGKYKKQWYWIYNVIGGPRVVFLTEKTKPRGLIVSTSHPEKILEIAKGKIGTP